MNSIAELLTEMRGRLPMYLGTNSLSKLASFLRGYELALDRDGVDHDRHFLSRFQDFCTFRQNLSSRHQFHQAFA